MIIKDAISNFEELSEKVTEQIEIANKQILQEVTTNFKEITNELVTSIKHLKSEINSQLAISHMNATSISGQGEVLRILTKCINSGNDEPPCKRGRHERRKRKSAPPGCCWKCRNTPDKYHWRDLCPNSD